MKISYTDCGWLQTLHAADRLPGFRILLLFLFLACLVGSDLLPGNSSVPSAHRATEAAPSDAAATSLDLHKWIEREIAPGDVHHYKVQAVAGHYFSIEIEHWGLSLAGTVSSPHDSESTEFTCRFADITPVSVITLAGGEYVLTVRAAASAIKIGRYQIRLKEIRVKAEWDDDRVSAERTLAAADQLRAAQRDDSNRQATEKYQEALVLLRAAPNQALAANALKNLGRTYEALGDNHSAFAYYQQGLNLSRKIKDQKSQAEILNCISYLDVTIGNNRQALAGAKDALRLSQLAGSLSGEARARFTSGEAHYGLGDLQKALEFDQQALSILRSLRDYRGQAEVLLNLGYAYSSLSRTTESREAYLEAVSLSRLVQDSRLEANSLRALATFQTRLGEYQQALDLFQQSLGCLNTVDDRLTKATVLGGIAYTYQNLGELRKALDYNNQAIALYQEVKNTWGEAETQMDSGRVSFALGDGKDALARYERALTLFRLLGMTRLQAQTLRDMGAVYDSWNDSSQALKFYHQSLRFTRPGQDQRYEAYTRNYIGHVLEASGDKIGATAYYRQALRLNRVAEDPAGEALTRFNLAHVARDLNLLDESLAEIEAGLKISESLRSKVASLDVRASYVASTHQYFELQADILMRLHRSRPTEGFAAAAFEASEKARARSLLELLREAHADIRQGADASLLDHQRSVGRELNTKAERHAELNLSGKKEEAQAVAKEVDRLTSDYEEIETQIRSQSPRYAALTQPQPLSLKEIQQQVLNDDTLLLEYMLGDERSYLWAISKETVLSYELPRRAEIEAAARSVYASLTANQPLPGETFAQRQARVVTPNQQLPSQIANLSKILLEPVADQLGTKRLLIVADGALQYIPFQILTKPANPHQPASEASAAGAEQRPLVTDHEIVNEPSASALALLIGDTATRKQPVHSVAVLADPVFEADDTRIKSGFSTKTESIKSELGQTDLQRALRDVGLTGNGGRIPRLPASRDEADAIMAAAPWWSGFKAIGFEANRATAMRPDLGDYRIVHFATHGFVNDEHPELSGVVLSLFDEKGQPQEGFLRLHDIYNLKLPVDLVVLSACNTGLGKDVRGEGLIGLTRGFMYAGASSVVASLWKVDDEATAELMRLFYGYMLQDDLSPAAALRKAQVTMSGQQRWQSPYFWAGFVIQGRYLQSERPSRFPIPRLALWGIGAAFLGAAGIYAMKRRRKVIL